MNFAQLDRRFRVLAAHATAEHAALDSYASLVDGKEPAIGWKELLTHSLVVVLGEPGSGKSLEFQNLANTLAEQGELAFYLRLDELVANPIEHVMTTADQRRWLTWKRGGQQATFLLDSVDEAKLRTYTDFGTALRRLQAALGEKNLHRARIVISSRISDWRPLSDAQTVTSILSETSPRTSSSSTQTDANVPADKKLYTVQLEPLDRSRVARFAHHLGIQNAEAFLQALDTHHAWVFARRPLDIQRLVGFWQTHHRLGSLSELIESQLEQSLREVEERYQSDPLTLEEARSGAESLAACAILCRKLSFNVTAEGVDDGTALNPFACLPPTWSQVKVRALLNRSLFDAESHGRIRFHHRQILEYLASQWIERCMRNGCGSRELQDLLLDTTKDHHQVRPSLEAVIAWLAIGANPWNEKIRQWILAHSPAIHFRHGDPAALPLDHKRQALRALVDRYSDRERVWIDHDPEILARLAEPRLSSEVIALIRDRNVSEDIRISMLSLVRHGNLQACMDGALEVIASADESDALKKYAIAALRDAGNTQHREKLRDISFQMTSFDSEFCGYLCEALYPAVIDESGLRVLIQKVPAMPKNTIGLPWMLENHLKDVLRPESSGRLIKELLSLASQKPYVKSGGKEIPVSEQFLWIIEVLPTALLRFLGNATLTEADVRIAIDALQLIGISRHTDVRDRGAMKDIQGATLGHSALRQTYFWEMTYQWKDSHGKFPLWSSQLYGFDGPLTADKSDLAWLISDVEIRGGDAERLFALQCAWDLTSRNDFASQRRLAVAAGRTSSTRIKYAKLILDVVPSALRRIWYRKLSHTLGSRWWWKRHFDRFRRFPAKLREHWMLRREASRLASGERPDWLAHLLLEGTSGSITTSWVTTDWIALARNRGKAIARATEKGCRTFWRQFKPSLPHERQHPNQTDRRILVGLAGLASESNQSGFDWSSLTPEEAMLATRYSVNELNGFAAWMNSLAKARPAEVSIVLGECIAGEWRYSPDREIVHEVIADLLYHGESFSDLFSTHLIDQLRTGDPLNKAVLKQAIEILLSVPKHYGQLTEIAQHRTLTYTEKNPEFNLWMAAWLQLDAASALPVLEQHLNHSADSTSLMVSLCCELGGRRAGNSLRVESPSYLRPEILLHLIPLTYKYIDPASDIDRAGKGVYSPGPRDDAQDFRDSLVRRLADPSISDAESVLLALAAHPSLIRQRDWIRHLLDQYLRQRSDGPAWQAVDIRKFSANYEILPRNEADLYAIARRRLLDVKDHVELDDNSPRNELREDDIETVLRSWLARKLIERSRDQYDIIQEEELDRGNPDLRFHRTGLGPVSVEIKWAHRWTADELLERLENQLVGQYMRASNARYGVYLIGRIGSQQHWRYGGKRLTFDKLMELLESRASELQRTRPEIYGLSVISIDFVKS